MGQSSSTNAIRTGPKRFSANGVDRIRSGLLPLGGKNAVHHFQVCFHQTLPLPLHCAREPQRNCERQRTAFCGTIDGILQKQSGNKARSSYTSCKWHMASDPSTVEEGQCALHGRLDNGNVSFDAERTRILLARKDCWPNAIWPTSCRCESLALFAASYSDTNG